MEISMISLIASLSLKLHLNSLVCNRNIFGCSSKVFGSFRKIVENVRVAFGTILGNLWKSSESGRQSSENSKKRRHPYAYIIIKGSLEQPHGMNCLHPSMSNLRSGIFLQSLQCTPCLVSVRLSPRPSQSIDFGDPKRMMEA